MYYTILSALDQVMIWTPWNVHVLLHVLLPIIPGSCATASSAEATRRGTGVEVRGRGVGEGEQGGLRRLLDRFYSTVSAFVGSWERE